MRSACAAALLVVVVASILISVHPQFFLRDDFQLQFLPGSREVARAWTSGTLPLLSPYSWSCAALAGEYQFGVFSIFRALLDVLVWLLPLSLTARAGFLLIAHAAVCAAGAFLLGRSYELRPSLSLMVALIAALNGWMLWWGTTWFVALAGFAWLPWYWLALRRRSWIGAALALYLLIAAGSPYVVAMAILVFVMNVRVPAIIGSALGVALAAPALLALFEYLPFTIRHAMGRGFEWNWVVPIPALFGLVIPSFTVPWPVFARWAPHPAVELLGAFVPLAGLVAAARSRDFLRRHAPELLLLIVVLVLMLLPTPPPLRWSFHWLPLFHLLLAVIGARALQEVSRAWLVGIVLAVITMLAAILLDREWRVTLIGAAVLIVLCAAWKRFPNTMPVAITLVMIAGTFVKFSARSEVPVWPYPESLLRPEPFDPSRTYLAMDDDLRNIELRPGNTPMLAGIRFVNGYSPIGLASIKNLFDLDAHGPMPAARAQSMIERESGPNQLLHHMGVDGLIVPNEMARRNAPHLARNGWRPVARIATCIVLHREPGLAEPVFGAARAWKLQNEREAYSAIFTRPMPQLPVILLAPGKRRAEQYGRRAITGIAESRHAISFVVRGRGPRALVVFRRPWLPGWRATMNGRTLPILRADMIMPAVEIPADAEGEVRLDYRPASVVTGAFLSAAALLVIVVVRAFASFWPRLAKT